MSEQLLGQNVALIYDFIRQAVDRRVEGEHWEALKMLDTAASLVYLDEDKRRPLDAIAESLAAIKEEALEIRTVSEESTEAAQRQRLNREAAKAFPTHLKELRDYMQRVGYYLMMNREWKGIIEASTMPVTNAPPASKNYPKHLSSDLA